MGKCDNTTLAIVVKVHSFCYTVHLCVLEVCFSPPDDSYTKTHMEGEHDVATIRFTPVTVVDLRLALFISYVGLLHTYRALTNIH